jgi:NTP pyrophosphatase (non-canonical NTP hydrolase)
MNRKQYITVTNWQDKIFTKATPLSCAHHLEEEAEELRKAIENGEEVNTEIADCFLLLFAVCNKSGLGYEDVITIIDEKMEVNYKRNWGKPNEKGYVKHTEG